MPKFGDWNEKDPNAGDGFTMIFQKLSNEKREGGPVHIPRLNSDHQASHEDSLGKHSQLGVQKTSNANDQPVSVGSSVCYLMQGMLFASPIKILLTPCLGI